MKFLNLTGVTLALTALAAVVLAGCGQQASAPGTTEVAAESHEGHDHAEGDDHDHGGWWCVEHGIPEEECSMCSAKAADEFKEKGDWCEEHNRANPGWSGRPSRRRGSHLHPASSERRFPRGGARTRLLRSAAFYFRIQRRAHEILRHLPITLFQGPRHGLCRGGGCVEACVVDVGRRRRSSRVRYSQWQIDDSGQQRRIDCR